MFALAAAATAAVLAQSARAEAWRQLSGPEISAALSSRTLGYPDGTMQDFRPDGSTLAGQSAGSWRVDGDHYCSKWPPSDTWSCYAVAAQGLDIRFTAGDGGVTVGRYADLN